MGFSGITKRSALGGLSTVAALTLASTSFAQSNRFDRVHSTGARTEFDIEGGKFDLLEYPPASEHLRAVGSRVGVRFQISEAHLGTRWIPMIGFSVASESGLRELQIDFGDLPIYECLVMSAELINYEPRERQQLAQVQVPRFKRRETQEIQIAIEPSSIVSVIIDNKRRPLRIDFQPHRLLVRPSGVKGWVEFVEPEIA